MSFGPADERGHMILTNLGDSRQIWHGLKVVAREIGIAPLPDLRHSLFNFYAKFLLAVAVLGQFPESEGQLRIYEDRSKGTRLKRNS